MKTKQYTIRSVPGELDQFLRRQARLQDKSLNRVVLDYLKQSTKLERQSADDDFGWLVGSNTIDQSSLKAMAEVDRTDKDRQLRELRS